MWRGGCFCGAIRYEADGPIASRTLCHCAMCRRIAGAPCVAWFTLPRSAFRLVQGNPATFHSSFGVTRSFCPQCGTHLSFADQRAPGDIDITTASLDDPQALPPLDHTYTASQLHWLHLADALPRYRQSRSEG